MEGKVFLSCIFVCFCICGINAQVSSLCRPNERLLECGCPKTCRDPFPHCGAVCKTGCFCSEGEVRNDQGYCVKLADCPSKDNKQDTSEPRINGGACPDNEEYRFCEPCNRTCDTPNPVCPAQCARGCFCTGTLLRDRDGRCVEWGECSNVQELIKNREKEFNAPIPARYSCGQNKVYRKCERCTRTCGDPEPVCSDTCRSGCFCRDGYVKGTDGKCVLEEHCPGKSLNS